MQEINLINASCLVVNFIKHSVEIEKYFDVIQGADLLYNPYTDVSHFNKFNDFKGKLKPLNS